MQARNAFPVLLLFALISMICGAQTAPTAIDASHKLWAGAEVSRFNPDWGCNGSNPFTCSGSLYGGGLTATYHFGARLSAAGEARWLEWNGSSQETESSYLIGPQYRLLGHGKIKFDGNVLFGLARFSNPTLTGTYFTYAPGAEMSYRVSHRLEGFLGYQVQIWPSFVGPPTVTSTGQVISHNHGLRPNGFSLGARYRVF